MLYAGVTRPTSKALPRIRPTVFTAVSTQTARVLTPKQNARAPTNRQLVLLERQSDLYPSGTVRLCHAVPCRAVPEREGKGRERIHFARPLAMGVLYTKANFNSKTRPGRPNADEAINGGVGIASQPHYK